MKLFCTLALLAILLHNGTAQAIREKEPLEAFDLQNLHLIRVTTEKKSGPTAWIRDPNGYLHRVLVGDYIGKNCGLVKKISKNLIELGDMYKDANGEWKERIVRIKVQPFPSDNSLRKSNEPHPRSAKQKH